MASSDSGRGRDDDSTNPFTKFSNFVDSQISTFLQGVIGLPSALTRSSINSTSGWADVPGSSNESPASHAGADGSQGTTTGGKAGDNEGTRNSRTANMAGWAAEQDRFLADLNHLEHALFGALPLFPSATGPGLLVDALSSRFPAFSPDRNWLSYVLFSPYSPLMLNLHHPELRILSLQRGGEQMPFPFTEAFEDLLRASQDKPLRSADQTGQVVRYDQLSSPAAHDWDRSMKDSVDWLTRVMNEGLLDPKFKDGAEGQSSVQEFGDEQGKERGVKWQKSWSWQYPPVERDQEENPIRDVRGAIESNKETERDMNTAEDPDAEQDVYDWISLVSDENERQQQRPQYSSPLDLMMQRQQQIHERFIKGGFDGFLDGKFSGKMDGGWDMQSSSSTTMTKSGHEDGMGSEQVISHTSKTERVMLEDGSIRTKTIVRERFADGRESSTESVHTEPSQVQSQTPSALKVDQATSPAAEKPEQKKQGEKEGKGWFWN